MNRLFLFMGLFGFLTQCRSAITPQASTALVNQEFKLGLNQQVTIWENKATGRNTNLGNIKLVQLEDSRCPTHTTCIRQGAVVTSLAISTPEKVLTVRLFIGDMMPNDSRNKRNLTTDTLQVTLKNKIEYQLILKSVLPYPGTSEAPPQATLLIKKP